MNVESQSSSWLRARGCKLLFNAAWHCSTELPAPKFPEDDLNMKIINEIARWISSRKPV
jgi:hypothetical protein